MFDAVDIDDDIYDDMDSVVSGELGLGRLPRPPNLLRSSKNPHMAADTNQLVQVLDMASARGTSRRNRRSEELTKLWLPTFRSETS